MRIVVTGTQGQVARSMVDRAGDYPGMEVIALGRPDMDLAVPSGVAGAIAALHPDVVVSAAAYTAVDKAQSESDAAFAVNERGAGAVAKAAQALGVPVIHLSTDYVFDGSKSTPYTESDLVAPLGVYGRSKLAGELAVMAAHPGAIILRTAWVYSPFGNNFVKTMLRLAETRDEVGVVADQIGCPTSALDIADGVLHVARRIASETTLPSDGHHAGVFHMTGRGEGSWADLAEAVFVASAARGGPSARVRRITTADFPTPTPRPANSRLHCSLLAEAWGCCLPDWHGSVEAVVARLV